MNLLSIDYGLKRVGLAISAGFIAEPLTVITNSKNLPGLILNICNQHAIDKIIIGLPGKSKMAQVIKRFAKQLEAAVSRPVVFWDETLTSAAAEELTKDKSKVDAVAAAIILQSYLDDKNKK